MATNLRLKARSKTRKSGAEVMLVVGRSRIQGNGAFSKNSVRKGTLVCKMEGRRVSVSHIEKLYAKGNSRVTVDGLQVSENEYVLLNKICNSINHSCEPNCAVVNENELIAIRDIEAGEEITYDYSLVEWTPESYTHYDHDAWPMRCNCETKTCRKVITCFPQLPFRKRTDALQKMHLPTHILERLKITTAHSCPTCKSVITPNKTAKRRKFGPEELH